MDSDCQATGEAANLAMAVWAVEGECAVD